MRGASPEERVFRIVQAARRIADPTDPLGREARDVLPGSTGLSPAGVALALERCLETDPTREEIASLVASVHEAPRAHVLLSANVFVAAHRAIALGLAASSEVFVRPSRREPEMVRLLARGAPELFRVVPELEPSLGDHAFVYGSDETIARVRQDFGPDVTVHAHGSGIGVVVVAADDTSDVSGAVEGIAEDVVLFDQRGCLSPRVVLVVGGEAGARVLANELARALDHAEQRVPRGRLDADEAASASRYRDTMRYGGVILPAGAGLVGLDITGGAVVVPPVGRHVHMMLTTDLERSAALLGGIVVTVATLGLPTLEARALSCFPGARRSLIGRMQRPPFDGPVDRRPERPAGC
jgi:Acyl-CoA reductase (LuxC)